jgi:hypothetical protein
MTLRHYAVVLLVITVVFACVWYRRPVEPFQQEIMDEPILQRTLQYETKPTLSVHMYAEDRDVSLESISLVTPLIQRAVRRARQLASGGELTYVKAYEMAVSTVDPRLRVLTALKEPVRLFFFKPSSSRITVGIPDLRGKRIGYIRQSDKIVVERLLEAYSLSIDQVTWVHLSPNDIFDALFERNECDTAAFLATKDSLLLKKAQAYNFSWIPYETLNMTQIKAAFPFCRRDLFTFEKSVNAALSEPITNTLLVFDTLLVGVPDPHLHDTYRIILDSINQPGKNSFYTQYFPFFKLAIQDIRAYSQQFTVETFVDGGKKDTASIDHRDDAVLFELNKHVNGDFRRIDPQRKLFKLFQTSMNGIRFKMHDRLRLNKQTVDKENGYYYVQDILKDIVILADFMTLHLPAAEFKDMQTDTSTGDSIWLIPLSHSLHTMLHEDDRVWIPSIKRLGVAVLNLSTSSLKIQFAAAQGSKDIEDEDESGECIEDSQYKTKALCEGTRDMLERDKNPMTWDKPCQKDEECPYYQESDKRGGCRDGYCEMPVGVKRKGYRRIDLTENKPLCSGCSPDVSLAQCCTYSKQYMFE